MHFISSLLSVSLLTFPLVAGASVFTVTSESILGRARVIYDGGKSIVDEESTTTSFSLFASGGEQTSKLDYSRAIDIDKGTIDMALSYSGHISASPAPLDATIFSLQNTIIIQFDTPTAFTYFADLPDVGIPLNYNYNGNFGFVHMWNSANQYEGDYTASRYTAFDNTVSFQTDLLAPGTWVVDFQINYWFPAPPTTRELTWRGTLSGVAAVPEPRSLYTVTLFIVAFGVARVIALARKRIPCKSSRNDPK